MKKENNNQLKLALSKSKEFNKLKKINTIVDTFSLVMTIIQIAISFKQYKIRKNIKNKIKNNK